MTNLEIIMYIAERAMYTFLLAALMSMFFGKRKTRVGIFLMSYLLFAALTPAIFWWLGVPQLSVPAAGAAIFVVTLNYDATMQKKLLVTIAALFVLIISEAAAVTAAGRIWLEVGMLNMTSNMTSLAVSVAVCLIVAIIAYFKNRR